MGVITERVSRSRSGDRTKPGSRGSTGDRVRRSATFSGESTLPGSRGSNRGSANSLNKSHNGSLGSLDDFDDCDNINVVVRVRPLNEKEQNRGEDSIITFPGQGQMLLEPQAENIKAKQFRFNILFEPEATQEDVLSHSGAKRMVEMAVEGYPCTIFCYGQTGSGKTHTLTGPPHLFYNKAYNRKWKPEFRKAPDMYSEDHGLVFRSFVYLFQVINEQKDKDFLLKASYLEIYNEKVIDLLNPVQPEPGKPPRSLMVRWNKKKRAFFVENLFTVECEELDDLLAVLEEGLRNRAVASHNMNEFSSRSHTILTVYITSEQKAAEDSDVYISKLGKLNFVDLAGSEMTKKTNSEGKTLEEANNINKSLMVLGTCISNLSDPKKKTGHIPYRDSKLTKLLADSLAGSGVTLMIACASPARSNISESLNTLRYASRAKRIKTKPIVVMDPRESLIISLKREVHILQQENDQLKALLNIGAHGEVPAITNGTPGTGGDARRRPSIAKLAVDKERLHELKTEELIELLQEYMANNTALRDENLDLHTLRDALMRDQDVIIKENERLLRKLEEINSRSPIVPARPTYSADLQVQSLSQPSTLPNTPERNGHGGGDGQVNVWTNPRYEEKKNSSPRKSKVPKSVDKELEKRQMKGSDNIKGKIQQRTPSGTRSADGKKPKSQAIKNDLAARRRAGASPGRPPRANQPKMKKASSTSRLDEVKKRK
ncbi:kinesin-like protein KIF12 isoform X3 [Amphibalanus amphitrite]|uniref:kinesin-like protein KIF12 isoform X3 n=1 Tax=Amphibalanus amphitrite TaxID=1232801 RepID=UPI001C910D4D|nr:kinesin-like protein KIF12 isoform X3 [Amphibalanus amphitrite]